MKPVESTDIQLLSLASLMGGLIGLGQLLNSDEKLSLRMVIGRAIVSAGLAACAPLVFLWFPDTPEIVEFAVAALFASLGTSGLQLVLKRFVGSTNL